MFVREVEHAHAVERSAPISRPFSLLHFNAEISIFDLLPLIDNDSKQGGSGTEPHGIAEKWSKDDDDGGVNLQWARWGSQGQQYR